MKQDLQHADKAFQNGLKAGAELASEIIEQELNDTIQKKYIIAKIKKSVEKS